MKGNRIYLIFTAACIAGGVYMFHPEFIRKYLDTVVVVFAALMYFLFVRPWLKQKLAVNKKDDATEDKKSE
ncbi:hypothetical protein [Halodesulfovibrio aestuarii]|uniref:Uncharacterized protein n=1 Tax=Halodesulfovibrio aestuarii TaxID=126333 RepID=A0A8G2F701_9BACT|nr:hypothetical protein [Halodesulfovibrio aestuarii]SHI70146.1 hypothetical protein SAMN05660830_00710 [Halodesulfovibrio aestuarii]